jgi:serine/threonine protein kinase
VFRSPVQHSFRRLDWPHRLTPDELLRRYVPSIPNVDACRVIIQPQMALTPGTRLGPYEVLAPLGAGGMGEVYRARDSKLGRGVALRILPEAFARDAERMARSQCEANVLASVSS